MAAASVNSAPAKGLRTVSGRPPRIASDHPAAQLYNLADDVRRQVDQASIIAALCAAAAMRKVSIETVVGSRDQTGREAQSLACYLATVAFGLTAHRVAQIGLCGLRRQGIHRAVERVTEQCERDRAYGDAVESLVSTLEEMRPTL